MPPNTAYLSFILDLSDRHIVISEMGDTNDSALVFDTFDKAAAAEPHAHPIFIVAEASSTRIAPFIPSWWRPA